MCRTMSINGRALTGVDFIKFLLSGLVYCAVCSSSKYMVVGKNRNGSGKHVLTYRCDNKQCTRSPRLLRAHNVFDSIYAKLGSLELADKAYERYRTELESYTGDIIIKIRQDIHSKRGSIAQLTKEINERSLAVAYKPNMKKLEDLSMQKSDLEHDVIKLSEKVANPKRIQLNKEEFLNLLKTAPDKMRAGSAVEKDILCRILFLNLRVDNKKVVDYLWNEPFATMVKMGELQDGGGGWT